MKDISPNCAEFEAAFHGKGEGPRARECTGPHPAVLSSPSLAVPPATLAIDINALLAVALIPMINRMNQDSQAFGHGLMGSSTPHLPLWTAVTTALVKHVTDFLEAFKHATHIDIIDKVQTLADLDFTPTLVANETISSAHLSEVLTLREGGILAVQKFAKEWVACRHEKSRMD